VAWRGVAWVGPNFILTERPIDERLQFEMLAPGLSLGADFRCPAKAMGVSLSVPIIFALDEGPHLSSSRLAHKLN
jgi:hypothetical protein